MVMFSSRKFEKIINICQKSRLHEIFAPKISQNVYKNDSLLPRLLYAIYEQKGVCKVEADLDLTDFGSKYNWLSSLAVQCEEYTPRLKRLDGWGLRIDDISTCSAWKELHTVASEEGLVAVRYDSSAELKEVHQTLKMLLFNAVSGMVCCPLAMTDGAASTLISLLDKHQNCDPNECSICSEDWKNVISKVVSNLTTRRPEKFWTSGQWMTERAGGSDVTASTETVARKGGDGVIRLYGNKFYTSAIDCNVSLVLARYNGNLSLFLVHLPEGFDGTIEVERLKDKMGTRQLPTAELKLNGLPALLLAEKGIASIIPMLQITRLHNAVSAASYVRHISMLAQEFARNRTAFGAKLNQLPLHKVSLAKLETCYRALAVQSLDLAIVLNAKEDEGGFVHVKRVLSAVVKIHTALVAVTAIRDGLETFGGAGYMEDTGLPGIFRDACVLPVWEGTCDVLSAETARALTRDPTAVTQVTAYIRDLAGGTIGFGGQIIPSVSQQEQSWKGPVTDVASCLSDVEEAVNGGCPYMARSVALGLGAAHAGAALIALARQTTEKSDLAAARMWCRHFLPQISTIDTDDIDRILEL